MDVMAMVSDVAKVPDNSQSGSPPTGVCPWFPLLPACCNVVLRWKCCRRSVVAVRRSYRVVVVVVEEGGT